MCPGIRRGLAHSSGSPESPFPETCSSAHAKLGVARSAITPAQRTEEWAMTSSPHRPQCRCKSRDVADSAPPQFEGGTPSAKTPRGPARPCRSPVRPRIRDLRFPSRHLLPETGRSSRYTDSGWESLGFGPWHGRVLVSSLSPHSIRVGRIPRRHGRNARAKYRGDINLRDLTLFRQSCLPFGTDPPTV